jgi:hypothetical protein
MKKSVKVAGRLLLKLLAYVFIFLINLKKFVLCTLLRRPDRASHKEFSKIRNSFEKVNELKTKRKEASRIFVTDLRNLLCYGTKRRNDWQKLQLGG